MVSAISGLILLFNSLFSLSVTKDKIHPAFVFSFVWGVELLIISVLSFIGFYKINAGSAFLYVIGAFTFSFTSLLVQSEIYPKRCFPVKTTPIKIETFRVIPVLILMNLSVIIYAFNILSSIDGDLFKAAFKVRILTVQGEDVFGPIINNYITFGFVIIYLMTVSLLSKGASFLHYLAVCFPLILLIIFVAGRAGLIQIVISLFFISYLINRKITTKQILTTFLFFIFVVLLGALTTKKFDLSNNANVNELAFILIEHIAAYAFQGPVLFSEYFDGKIFVSENWDPLRSIKHILSFLGGEPPPFLHLEFNKFGRGVEMLGNVYSLYFSIYPNYGLLGAFFFLIIYSFITTVIYNKAKNGSLLYIFLAGHFFSAMVLSIFSDLFFTSIWILIKSVVFLLFFNFIVNFLNKLSLNWRSVEK